MNKISNSTHIFIYIMDINRYIDTYKNKNLVSFSINLSSENSKKKLSSIPMFSKITKTNQDKYINSSMNGLAIRLGLPNNDKTFVILLDIDNKDDTEDNTIKNGMRKWKELMKIHDKNNKIKTMRQTTGNNGLHYLFKVKEKDFEKLPNMITELNIDEQKYSIDFKGKNQFVIVEPTNYDNKYYKWDDINEEIQMIPKWIFNLLISHKKIIKTRNMIKQPEQKKETFIQYNELKEYIDYLDIS